MAKSDLEKKLGELAGLKSRGVITEEEYESRRAALLSDTSAGEEGQRRGGGIFKWGMMGCLGIFAAIGLFVIVVIALLAAAVGGSADKVKDSGGDVHVALAQGAVGEIAPESNGSKKTRVTILQIADGAQSNNQFSQPADGKKYWAVEVEVENVGTREVTSLDWKLRDSADTESDETFVSGVGESLPPFYNLTPGGKQRGWVVFEIAADASPKWLRADPNIFLAHDLYFDAQ
ncbi:MAG TPA: DUF4352 domain-containing protein [Tepidiformaceae bacterium]|nr:DUF4352 domain-containing protein [Tepidiformaceae bacterium]